MNKDEMFGLLEDSSNVYGDDKIPFQKKILNRGNAGLQILKSIALDKDIDVNIRKSAIYYIAKYPGDSPGVFIAENFVNGKNPSQLYAMYESGEDQMSFPLLREAKECLEGLGYDVR